MVGIMSETVLSLNERLAFYKIDAAARGELETAWSLIAPHMPRIISDFYRHLAKFPMTARLVDKRQDRLAKLQAEHWRRLFTSGFDESYLTSVRAVAVAHVRVGVEPDWYIGGYSVILAELTTVLAQETRLRSGRLARLASAVGSAVMFDMGIAVSVYHETLLTAGEERRTRLTGEIDIFDRTFSHSLSALNQAAHVMRGASEQLGEATGRTSEQADNMTMTAEEMAERAARSAAAAGTMAKSIEAVESYAQRAYESAGKAAEQATAMPAWRARSRRCRRRRRRPPRRFPTRSRRSSRPQGRRSATSTASAPSFARSCSRPRRSPPRSKTRLRRPIRS